MIFKALSNFGYYKQKALKWQTPKSVIYCLNASLPKKLSIQNSFPQILWYPIVGSKSSELACVAKTLKFYFFFNTFWFPLYVVGFLVKSSFSSWEKSTKFSNLSFLRPFHSSFFREKFWKNIFMFDIQITSSQKKSSGLLDVDFLAKQKTHQLQILIQIILHV